MKIVSILVPSGICLFFTLFPKTTHANTSFAGSTVHGGNNERYPNYGIFGSDVNDFRCSQMCGRHAICDVANQIPTCECLYGYEGDPYGESCVEIEKVCTNDHDCMNNELCHGNVCVNGCRHVGCTGSSICYTTNHVPTCKCNDGHVGDAYDGSCDRRGNICNSDQDCKNYQVCHNNICVYGCNPSPCGKNTSCAVNDHVRTCKCLKGYEGDAYGNGCAKITKICNRNHNCEDYEICHGNICVNGCDHLNCNMSTTCDVNNHVPTCKCSKGYKGDLLGKGCVKSSKSCNRYKQCADHEVCNNNICTSNCTLLGCGSNTVCYVRNHIHICKCLRGYEGNAYGKGCVKSGEVHDSDQNRENVEDNNSNTHPSGYVVPPCGANTRHIKNNVSTCECLPGYEGAAHGKGCIKIRYVCDTNQNYGDYEVRNITTCVSGCKLLICGINTICHVNNRVPTCECLPGYEGHAYGKGCIRSKEVCEIDQHCQDYEICKGNICTLGCEQLTCGIHAVCQTSSHVPTCKCLNGFEGDPYSKRCVRSKGDHIGNNSLPLI